METAAERIAPSVERLSLRTPTLPPATETNTYFIENDGEFIVVEPASPHRAEQTLLFHETRARIDAGRRLVGGLVTHHHSDHVGAARAFRSEFAVPMYAHAMTRERLRGEVEIDDTLVEGDTLLGATVSVFHTPGHAPGHVCLFHGKERWFIVGDMVASVGTIVIDPDDAGDMHAYIAQLERLRAVGAGVLLPAHGAPILDADARLAFYVRHRLEREGKVRDALRGLAGRATVPAIVAVAYADTPPILWPLAACSARAHLARLAKLGEARADAGEWIAT